MNSSILKSEITLKAIKSSGSGGQHVNKVATKIELQFHVLNSLALTQQEKALILVNLKSRLTKNNVFCQIEIKDKNIDKVFSFFKSINYNLISDNRFNKTDYFFSNFDLNKIEI